MSANEPLDLTELFGEAWCVTLTAHPVDAALAAVNVTLPTSVADGLGLIAQHQTAGGNDVVILAHAIPSDRTLILQLEPTGGWAGTDPTVLNALTSPRATTCTITYLPNGQEVWFAEPGGVISGIDPLTGRRWGTPSPSLSAALDSIGYPADADEPSGTLDRYTAAQCAGLTLRAATGLNLHRSHFASPWTGGLRPIPR